MGTAALAVWPLSAGYRIQAANGMLAPLRRVERSPFQGSRAILYIARPCTRRPTYRLEFCIMHGCCSLSFLDSPFPSAHRTGSLRRPGPRAAFLTTTYTCFLLLFVQRSLEQVLSACSPLSFLFHHNLDLLHIPPKPGCCPSYCSTFAGNRHWRIPHAALLRDPLHVWPATPTHICRPTPVERAHHLHRCDPPTTPSTTTALIVLRPAQVVLLSTFAAREITLRRREGLALQRLFAHNRVLVPSSHTFDPPWQPPGLIESRRVPASDCAAACLLACTVYMRTTSTTTDHHRPPPRRLRAQNQCIAAVSSFQTQTRSCNAISPYSAVATAARRISCRHYTTFHRPRPSRPPRSIQ